MVHGINLYLNDEEYNKLKEHKKELTYKEYILSLLTNNTTNIKPIPKASTKPTTTHNIITNNKETKEIKTNDNTNKQYHPAIGYYK